MDPFAQFDAALLGFARKIVNVWSRATGKTNFALARLLAKTSFVFLLACILSLSAFWHFGISFMFVWFVVLPFELLSKIIPDFEKEAKRQDERNAAPHQNDITQRFTIRVLSQNERSFLYSKIFSPFLAE